jgi:hypothetical protein
MRKTLPERVEEACLDKAVVAMVFLDFSAQKIVDKNDDYLDWSYMNRQRLATSK